MGPNGSVHHVIDPFSGASTDKGLCGVAVLAGAGWWAEALTKAVLAAGVGSGLDVIESIGHGAHAMSWCSVADFHRGSRKYANGLQRVTSFRFFRRRGGPLPWQTTIAWRATGRAGGRLGR